MDTVVEVLKRIIFSIILITITNVCLNMSIAYSLFNIGLVAIFTIPGLVVLIFMVYFLE
jgi:hypothetical protein